MDIVQSPPVGELLRTLGRDAMDAAEWGCGDGHGGRVEVVDRWTWRTR